MAVAQPRRPRCNTLLTCVGFRPTTGSSFWQIAGLQALKDHFRSSEYALDLGKRGAKGTRTPGLLHAIHWQAVHRSTSVQVTVPERADQSAQIRTGCCIFPLYESSSRRRHRTAVLGHTRHPRCGRAVSPAARYSGHTWTFPVRRKGQPADTVLTQEIAADTLLRDGGCAALHAEVPPPLRLELQALPNSPAR
jgi:hypothetical protein